ncbi:hypothetical protein LQZ18_18275 [Lachnospiraceae bacterium ZAX-1]
MPSEFSRKEVESLSKKVDFVAKKAIEEFSVKFKWTATMWYDNVDLNIIRGEVSLQLERIIRKYGSVTQTVAQELLKSVGIPASAIPELINQEILAAETVIGLDGMVKKNDADQSGRYYNGIIDRVVKDGYRKMVAYNSKRYARIPTGTYTCPWCVMMASRGYVYISEDTAAASSHFYCNCLILPGGKKVAGYDPDFYYDLYKQGKGVGEKPKRGVALDTSGNQF